MKEKTREELLNELSKLQNDFDNYKASVEKKYKVINKESIYTLETIFQTNPDSVTITKIDNASLLLVNKSFLDITGYKVEEVIGKTTNELNIWVDLNDRKKLIFEIEQHGQVKNFETKFRMKDGSIIDGLVSGKTFIYKNEFCLLLITRDITDHKKLINRAILNELRFRAFFRNKDSGVSVADLNGNFINVNEKSCNMLGYTLDELRKLNYKDVSYKGDINANEEMLNKLYSGEINSFTLEKRFVRKDNTYYWAEIFVAGIFDKYGKLVETIGIQNDITKRKYEALKNRITFELSNLIEEELDDNTLYKKLTNILSELFSIRDNYFAVINKDNSISYNIPDKRDKSKNDIYKKEELLIRHIVKNKKTITLNRNEIPNFFEKISGKKQNLKVECWQGAPIFILGKVCVVLVVRLFEESINLSSKQNELLEDTAKIISDLFDKRKVTNEIRLLSHVLEQSPVIAIITDINGNIEYTNKESTKITGYKKEELLNKNPRIFKSGETKKETYEELWKTVLGGKTWIGDLHNRKKNGELYWSRNIISPIKNSTGRITNLVSLNLDVTKLKEAELESQKFNLLINSSKDFIAFRNMDEQLTYLNKGGRELVGLSTNADITKLKIKDFLSEEDYKITVNQIIPTVMKNGFWNGEHSLKHFKTGKTIPVLSSIFLIKEPTTGKPIGVGSIQHDLTEKNEAIKALQQSEEKFKTLAENSINMIYIFRKNKFLYVNKMFANKFEYTKEDIYSPKFNLFEKLIAPESKIPVKKGIEEHKKHKEIKPYELTMVTKTGIKIEAIDSSTIIKFNGEEAVMGILTDITELKKVEQEIIAAKEKAEELNRLKSSFYANMSHELRTPLVGIMGSAEILMEEIENEQLREMSSTIYSSGTRLTKTLNNILNLSKVNSEKMLFDLTNINVAEIISERVSFFNNAAKNKGLYIKYSNETGPLKLKLDGDKFIEILDNLLNNAIKFTNVGGIDIKLKKQNFKGNIYSVISIKDTGIGIASKDIKFIFDEYRQVSEGLARKFEGTGLGLTISKKYVELMNGTIEVESKINKGSKFILKFPLD